MKYKILLVIGIIILIVLINKPVENFLSSPGITLQNNAAAAANAMIKGQPVAENSKCSMPSLQKASAATIGDSYTNSLANIIKPLHNPIYRANDNASLARANNDMAGIMSVPKIASKKRKIKAKENVRECFENDVTLNQVITQSTPAPNTLPITANINNCEDVTNTNIDNFNNPKFANCGICFKPGQTSNKNLLPRIGGFYFSPDDMSLLKKSLDNPELSYSEKNKLLKNAKPTIGSCPLGHFAVNAERAKRLENEIKCIKSQSFSIPGCSQCSDNGKFSYIDIEDAGLLIPRLMLIGKGTLVLNGNTIELSDKLQQIDLNNNKEGDIIILDVTGDNAYIAGYIAGDTAKGEYRQDIYRLIDADRTSGSKPKLSGEIIAGNEICMKIVPTRTVNNWWNISYNKNMQLQLTLVYSFLGTESDDSLNCATSPYITKESSAKFLSSGSCYKEGNGPGSYSDTCLQEIWAQAGCTNMGSEYPANTTAIGNLNRLGKIQKISEYVYNLALNTITGRDRSGAKLSLKELGDATLKCTGKVIENACDIINPGEPITQECMRILYLNAGKYQGATYGGTRDQMTKNADGKLVFCTDAGLINPLNNGTTEFSSKSGKVLFSELPNGFTNFGRFEIKKNYRITCIVRPTGVVSNWGSLYHFTRNGTDANSVGERMPGVWFYPGSTQLHVRIGDSSNLNWGYDPHISLPLNQDTLLQITAIGDNITISIGSAEFKFRQQTPGGRPSGLAYLFAPDPWYSRMQGSVKNLTLTTSDGNLPGSVASYAVSPAMSINEIKSKYNAAFNDMVNGDPNGLAACRGIAVAEHSPTYPSSGNWENRVEGTRVNLGSESGPTNI